MSMVKNGHFAGVVEGVTEANTAVTYEEVAEKQGPTSFSDLGRYF